MNISKSKYFFEIDKTKPVYGLILPFHNKFYILDNDYETLKFIQFLIIKHEWFAMHHFDSSPMFNNTNCCKYGCDQITAKLASDYDIYPLSIEIQTDETFFDFNLQETLFYVRKVLVTTKKIIEKNINDIEFKNLQNNTIMIKKFLKMISFEDENIKKIIAEEEQILNNNKNFNEKLLSYVINILYSLDLKNIQIEDIKKELSSHLEEIFKKIYFKDKANTIEKIVHLDENFK